MNWQKKLVEFECTKDWKSAIKLLLNIINEYPNNVDAYIRLIYLLLHVLLEEEYSKDEHDRMTVLLKEYFNKSYNEFAYNAEYLFFIGYFMGLAEWYFGQDDLKLADEMKRRACELDPGNILYEWSCRFSSKDPLAGYYAAQLLRYDKQKIKWLKTKGSPGAYILDVIERFCKSSKLKLEEGL